MMKTPSAPRSHRDNMPRGSSTRGIHKRHTPYHRPDRDGDVVMSDGDNKFARRGRSTREPEPMSRNDAPSNPHARSTRKGYRDQPLAAASDDRRRTRQPPASVDHSTSRFRGGLAQRISASTSKSSPAVFALSDVSVQGLKESKAARNAHGGLPDLQAFLERKAAERKKPVSIRKTRIEGDIVIFTVPSNEIQSLLILNGFSFAGSKLSIQKHESQQHKSDDNGDTEMSDPEEHFDMPTLLKGFLDRRYDSESRFLNLAAFGTDAELDSIGMFDNTQRAKKFFLALMKFANTFFSSDEEKAAAVVSVSLANNSMENVNIVRSLADTFPAIQNLDLSDNSLADMRALRGFRFKFPELSQLIITGNGVSTEENAANIAKLFPSLSKLNNITVRARSPTGFRQPGEGKSEEQVEKEWRAQQLSNATGMTIEWSGRCLEEFGWELEPAWQGFSNMKETLPVEAFVQGKALGL